jgi:hypothetical protein
MLSLPALRYGGPVDRQELQTHILATYISLRIGMVAIGALLPIVVYLVGAANGIDLAGSISAYYWEANGGDPPSRNWFVGSLFAIAACLYLYKGFRPAENVALNAAAIFAVGVAVFPTPWNCKPACPSYTVHGTSAILLFGCLAYVVWFRARDTLTLLPAESAARYRKLYNVIGLVMLLSPLTAFVLNSIVGARTSYVFFIEAAGIWAFAAYWFVKSRELKESSATTKAVGGGIQIAADGRAQEAPEAALPPEEAVSA